MSSTAPPRVLAILPGLIPSTMMTVVKPLLALHRAGRLRVNISLESLVRERDLVAADLLIFCRNTEPGFRPWFQHAQQLGKPYIYDLDDNFFEMSAETEVGRYHADPARAEQLKRYLAGASWVRVYSDLLVARVAEINPRVERVAPPLDWSLIPDQPPVSSPLGVVKIVYATSRVDDQLAALFLDDLLRMAEERPGQVEIHFWGYNPPHLRGHPAVRFTGIIRDYDRYLRRFYAQGYDIGLAPLLDDAFHRSKSNAKFREYGACRVAGIYSNVAVYSDCVAQGETGLLVPNEPGAWYAALTRLVDDVALRGKIKAQAQQAVRRDYSQEKFEAVWHEQIKRVLTVPAPEVVASPMVVSTNDETPTTEARPQPVPVRLLDKGRRMALRLVRHGPAALSTLQWYGYNLWMLSKIRFLTSPLATLLPHRPVRRGPLPDA